MIAVLKENPLLLLFLVAAIGYPLGRVKVGGASLGVAAVLFVGLFFGALDPDLKLPEAVYQLGLVLFVYTIGLSSGGIFFASLGKRGLRFNLLVAGGLLFAAGMAVVFHLLFKLDAAYTAGMYAGSLTNTPALAGVVEHIKSSAPADMLIQLQAEPVIAYSLTYPIGVLGMILTIYVFQRVWKIDYAKEAQRAAGFNSGNEPLHSRTICITREDSRTVSDLMRQYHWDVVFGRLRDTNDHYSVTTGSTVFYPGDLVTLIGAEKDLDEVMEFLGKECGERLELDLTQYDKRRIFVSNSHVVGRRLRDLDLIGRYGAIVTRVRRGDTELLPDGQTVLAPGDQVRVVAPPDKMNTLAQLLGDSYRVISEIDILTFSLGLAVGLLLGMLPIPMPGGVTLRLGIAGGPLIVALVAGALGRTGPFIWTLPYGANLTLRQIGLIFFLAGIGTRSGYAFYSTFGQGSGLLVFLSGAVITCLTCILILWVGYRLLKIPMGLLVGILAGMQTQPAVLGFGLEQSGDELPNIGYTIVYPIAMILKILLAQALLILFL